MERSASYEALAVALEQQRLYRDGLIGCDPRVVQIVAEWAQLRRENAELRERLAALEKGHAKPPL